MLAGRGCGQDGHAVGRGCERELFPGLEAHLCRPVVWGRTGAVQTAGARMRLQGWQQPCANGARDGGESTHRLFIPVAEPNGRFSKWSHWQCLNAEILTRSNAIPVRSPVCSRCPELLCTDPARILHRPRTDSALPLHSPCRALHGPHVPEHHNPLFCQSPQTLKAGPDFMSHSTESGCGSNTSPSPGGCRHSEGVHCSRLCLLEKKVQGQWRSQMTCRASQVLPPNAHLHGPW